MFKTKKTSGSSDFTLLLNALDQIIEGNYAPIDPSTFNDTSVGEKYNAVLEAFKRSNNNYVMRLNDAMYHIGDSSYVKNMLEQVNKQNDSIQEMEISSHDLKDSINNISDEVGHIKDNAQDAIEISARSVTNMNESIRVVQESTDEIRGINDKVLDFQEKTAKITEIIDIVKKLAKQSNLLALNASIEAARAGEAGKGFSVVANQVKELSSSTNESAEKVVMYVDELQSSIGELVTLINDTTGHLTTGNEKVQQSVSDIENMNHQMSLINDRINNIYEAVNTQSNVTNKFVNSIGFLADGYEALTKECHYTGEHFYRIGRYIDTCRSDMARGFSNLTQQDWLKVFKTDHFIFTWRVYNNLAKFEHLRIEQLNNPKGCKFGKWVGGLTDQRILADPEFKKLVEYHDNVHRHAVDSWNYAEKDDTASALDSFNKTLDSYNKFSKQMDVVMNNLKRIGYTEETEIIVFSK